MPSPVNRAKKFAAMSLLVLGYGAYNGLRAEIQPCTSFNEGRCDQFCIDRGADAEWCSNFGAGSNCMCTNGSSANF